MEETKTPSDLGEGTSTPSTSETEPVSNVETSEADTSDQPTEETTVKPPSRAQERISKLAQERDYWKDLAMGQTTDEPTEPEEEGTVSIKEVAKKTAEEVTKSLRAQDAYKAMVNDAIEAEELYPELKEDNDLASDVIALAQARGIPIKKAAERLIGLRREATTQTEAARSSADQAQKTTATSPGNRKVASNAPQKLDLTAMTAEEKAANWSKILEQYQQEE